MKKRFLLLFLLATFFAPWTAFGQQLTVYDGTVTSNTVPAYIFYFDDFTRSQFVIPAADLTAMNGKTIQSMTFYTTSSNIPYTTVSSADVYLMEVDYTEISAFEPKASATTVYSGYFDIVSKGNGGTLTINFSTPYTYQGGNLLVGIENTEDNGYLLINFCGQTVNGASVAGYNDESLDEVVPSQQNFIPKTTFTFVEELTVYDGTTTNNTVPAYIFYFDDFTKSHFIIPSDDLAEMLETPIISMTFYTTAANVPYTTVSSANLYLAEDYYNSTINTFYPFSSSNLHYQGYFDIVSTPEGGKMTINFSTPYTYHGGNLIVGIENTEDNGWKNIFFYGQTVEGASVSGSNGTSLSDVQPTQRNFIPKTTFGYIPNCPPCPLPYSCGFESLDELECWTGFFQDYWSPIVEDVGVGGSNCYVYVPDQMYQHLISPKLEGTTDMAVSFWYKVAIDGSKAANEVIPETFRVGYSTTTKALVDFTWDEMVAINADQWWPYEAVFPQGTKYVAIQYTSESEYASGLLIDDFNVMPSLCPPGDQCQLTFELTDYYGDGWNGAAIRVVDVETNVVLALMTNNNLNGITGNGTNELNTLHLNVCDGRALRFEWVPGEWDDECSYTVRGVNGVIFSGDDAMSEPVTHTVDCTLRYIFVTSGDWNDGSHWNTGYVPPAGADVIIQADVTVPTGYVAVANEVTLDGGSITVADRAQLKHHTYGLEVTMEKNIKGYDELNDNENYHLLMFPFVDATLPQAMTASSGYDLYKFDPNNADAEWRNDRVTAFTGAHFWDGGYLYASPVDMEISVTGTTFDCDANVEFTAYYDANSSNNFNGWNLLGNPYTCNAYVYAVEGENLVPMEVVMYNDEGELVTHANGPIYPMQGFFVHVTQTTTIRITTTPPEYEYVDLGLPSGTKWATCNVGASSPEDYGDYFAWGETQPKETYTWENYQHSNGGTSWENSNLTKYCSYASYGYNGFTDNLTTLQPEDDAATANWGNGWCMPTQAQWEELYDNTTVTWTQQNGVNGRLFTASNGNSLFLPVAGYRDDSSLYYTGSNGYYWSSSLFTLISSGAWDFYFSSGSYDMKLHYRSRGFPVRPVRSPQTEHAYVDLGLPSGLLWATCNVGAETPEDYGDYFAWGETTPKDTYDWSNYQHCNGSQNTLTKYCNDANYGYNGFTDNLTTLLPEDDAATANWGGGWRMPTKEEWQELLDNTTVTWTTQNGVDGRLFTAANGNSLFLPTADSNGFYWSSSLYTGDPSHAWDFYFLFVGFYDVYGDPRFDGFTVRPVREN